MPFDFDTITKAIQSPPGTLAAAAVLAGVVWKFFEKVEGVLTDQTKFEIAVWLVGVKVGQKMEPWPRTFSKIFDQVFGAKHLSWKCFRRSVCASCMAVLVANVWWLFFGNISNEYPSVNKSIFFVNLSAVLCLQVIGNVLPDYISLLKSRKFIRFVSADTRLRLVLLCLLADFLGGAILALFGMLLCFKAQDLAVRASKTIAIRLLPDALIPPYSAVSAFGAVLLLGPPALGASMLTSIWFSLYAGSGLLLKAARRFDIGFDWFNRKLDIEKKPLSAIGLVAGAIVAVVFCAAAIGAHVLK
jgi:hypothetical protein